MKLINQLRKKMQKNLMKVRNKLTARLNQKRWWKKQRWRKRWLSRRHWYQWMLLMTCWYVLLVWYGHACDTGLIEYISLVSIFIGPEWGKSKSSTIGRKQCFGSGNCSIRWYDIELLLFNEIYIEWRLPFWKLQCHSIIECHIEFTI